MRRAAALILAAVLVFALLAACAKESEADAAEASTAEALTAEITAITETEAEMNEQANIKSDRRAVIEAFDISTDSGKSAVMVEGGSIWGARYNVGAPFDGVSACMPTWTQTDSQCRISLYRWDGDFDTTLKSEPIASEFLDYMSDNGTNSLDFDEAPAGEYLFVISDTVGSAGIWVFPPTVSKCLTYLNGLEGEGDPQVQFSFAKTPFTPFTECKSMYTNADFYAAPTEYQIPDGDVLRVRAANPDTLVAVDELGRALPTNAEVGDRREDKYVAMFYWSWHESQSHSGEPCNTQELVAAHPEIVGDYNSPLWPEKAVHFWNEPLFGYYSTDDRWVIRRHAEMLANAGVDVIFFDNTNGNFTWRKSYLAIFDVFEEARRDGVMTPKISFLLPFSPSVGSREQLRSLYTDIYKDSKYQDLWFYLDGKPMLMAWNSNLDKSDPLDRQILEFFTFRPGQPTYDHNTQTHDQWGWLSVYPQQTYRKRGEDEIEEMTVGVAQNWSAEAGLTAMNAFNVFGRSYTSKGRDSREDSSLYGANFAEQWEYALQCDPRFVFVTGWNEWIAGRAKEWQGVENAFPDEFNDEYSRDIEPTKGPLADNYYYQLVSYIRRFKGAAALPEASEKKRINIHSDADEWVDVSPEYIAYKGNTFDRDSDGYVGCHYTDTSGRNDIVSVKVARDDEYLYIMVDCADTFTPSDGTGLRVYLKTSGDSSWQGYNFLVNGNPPENGLCSIERFTGVDFTRESVGSGEISVKAGRLQLKLPRESVAIPDDGFTLDFKVTDNQQSPGDVMDFYLTGDCAPLGRFNYRYIG